MLGLKLIYVTKRDPRNPIQEALPSIITVSMATTKQNTQYQWIRDDILHVLFKMVMQPIIMAIYSTGMHYRWNKHWLGYLAQ